MAERLYVVAGLDGDLQANFATCAAFFRDTTLPDAVLGKYRPGVLLREPTFCDVSCRPGGFVARHRYLIFSANARALPGTPEGWGMCLWPRGRIFKVLDRVAGGYHAQVTLLEVPEHLVEVFLGTEPNEIERAYASHGRDLFAELREAPPVPELDTDLWRDRLRYPVGVADDGRYFPLYRAEDHLADESRSRLVRAVRHQVQTLLDVAAYADAEDQVRVAVEAVQPAAARAPDALAGLLVSRSDLHLRVVDYRAAEADLHEAFRLHRQVGEDRLPVADVLSRLGHLYQNTGDDAAAERHYLHALRIQRQVAGERSAGVTPILVSLGALEERRGHVTQAQHWLEEALEIARVADRAHDPTLLNNLARVQQANGEFDAAERGLRAAVASLAPESTGGAQHLALLANLAEVQAARGESADALSLFTEVLRRQRKMVDELGSFASHEQRLAVLRAGRSRLAQHISMVVAKFADDPECVRRLADMVLNWKGLGIDTFAREREAVTRPDHPQLRPMLAELSRLRAWIAQRQMGGPDQSDPRGFDEELRQAARRYQEVEKAIARTMSRVGPHQPSAVDSSSVAHAIPAGAAVIELLRYVAFDFDAVRSKGERPWGPQRYVAVVFTPAQPQRPVLVDLGVAGPIDELVAGVRTQLTGRREYPADLGIGATERLYEAVFAPLSAAMGDARRLFFAPDGDLLRLPFEVLTGHDGRQLIDTYTISYLTSGRDLLRLRDATRAAAGPPVVVAAPDFDLGASPGAGRPLVPLNGARREGEVVGRLLGVRPSVAGEATKTAVEHASSPLVLHIATHGFVLKHQPALLPAQFLPGMTVRPSDPDREMLVLDGILATPSDFVAADDDFSRMAGSRLANPLLRAGLALAGANHWLAGGEPLPTVGNGILTAQEVTDLNLTGTELVVLSACDTGLGEVDPGEGVLGLRRSFVIAGARTLVMSLWKVPDGPTRQLMENFYRLLREGRTRVEALREAQLLMREHAPARCWAAFICQGEGGPLIGLPPPHTERRADMSEDRGSFLIDDTCPECELSRGRHEPWCSAYETEPARATRVPDRPESGDARRPADKE